MNPVKLRNIIAVYKRYFPEINNEEIYKWRAVKCFQDNWDIDAADFANMLRRSLLEAKNLLDSGQYYPKRMLLNNATRDPDAMRTLFKNLYDEDTDLVERITGFRDEFKIINASDANNKQSFQDDRAIMVYLMFMTPVQGK